MATIVWNGSVSNEFHNPANWDTGFVPGSTDVAITSLGSPTFPIITGAAHLAGLSITSSGYLSIEGRASLTVAGGTIVEGGMGVGADTSVNFAALDLLGASIDSAGAIVNYGTVTVSNSVDAIGAGLGQIQNIGKLTLVAGALNGRVDNLGRLTVATDGPFLSGALSHRKGSLFVEGQYAVRGTASLSEGTSFRLDSDPLACGAIHATGNVSLDLPWLLLDTAAVGALSAGDEYTLITSDATFDQGDLGVLAITGQATDFSYVLGYFGTATATGSLELVALNSGLAGGTAVLDMSAATRAVTAQINTDTGDGIVKGGRFVDALWSRFVQVDAIKGSAAGDEVTASGTTGIVIQGLGGADRLTGAAGRDTLGGGSGADTLMGGDGNDLLVGGSGGDLLLGGVGDDTYVVETATDLIRDSGGNDLVQVTVTYTLVSGIERGLALGTALISLAGNGLDNRLVGNNAANILTGYGGQDILIGNGGADRLSGNSGNDRLNGGGGGDRMDGGTGNDTLTGGTGSDSFVFRQTSDRDIITDFAATGAVQDRIDLSNVQTITSFADLVANHMRSVGTNVVIDALNGDVLTLANVRLADLDAANFLL